MEIYADIRQKVDINPIDVIQRLIYREITDEGVIFEKDGKYYRSVEISRVYSEDVEITKEKYEYVRALELVLETLKQK